MRNLFDLYFFDFQKKNHSFSSDSIVKYRFFQYSQINVFFDLKLQKMLKNFIFLKNKNKKNILILLNIK